MAKKANNPENLKPFAKGQSGNPGGRPRKLPEIDEMLITVFGDKQAIISILNGLKKKAASGDVRACELIFDRCYGKLKQSNEINIEFDNLTESQLDELISRILQTSKQ